MVTYTITFSVIEDGKRVPLFIEGREATLIIEADSRTQAVNDPYVENFCRDQGNDCRPRRVVP